MANILQMEQIDQLRTNELLTALAEQLAARGLHFDLVVIGGSGLLALGLISRPTRDVDVVAFLEGRNLLAPRPLPEVLVAARARVARDFGLTDDWLNAKPADLLDFGLPPGFVDRLERAASTATRSRFTSQVALIKSTSSSTHWSTKAGASTRLTCGRSSRQRRSSSLRRWAQTHDPSKASAWSSAQLFRT
jgi:hypothetical protein